MFNFERFDLPVPILLVSIFSVAMTFNGLYAQTRDEGDAWNSGSVFAAGLQCEARGLMDQGQTTVVLALTMQRLPSTYAEQIRNGYQEGLKRSAIYSKNAGGRWIPFTLTQENCKQVDYAVKQYKIAVDAIRNEQRQNTNVGLTGETRAQFVAGTTNGCLRDNERDPVPLSKATVAEYCRCYANAVADRVSPSELMAQEQMGPSEQNVAMRPKVETAARSCMAIVHRR
jgi:hypothetical protein